MPTKIDPGVRSSSVVVPIASSNRKNRSYLSDDDSSQFFDKNIRSHKKSSRNGVYRERASIKLVYASEGTYTCTDLSTHAQLYILPQVLV